jgi:hypothetical protein
MKLMMDGLTVVRITCWDKRTGVITAILRDDTSDEPSKTHEIKLATIRSLAQIPEQKSAIDAPNSLLYQLTDRVI